MRIVCLILVCLSLISCKKPPKELPTDLPDLSGIELSEAAIGVDESLQNLAIVMAEHRPIYIEPRSIDQVDFGMYQLATVDWAGPAEPLIRRLAQVEDYHVRVLGKAPPSGALVTISKEEATVGEILRDVALQIQNDADVVIFPQNQLIEVRYSQNSQYSQ